MSPHYNRQLALNANVSGARLLGQKKNDQAIASFQTAIDADPTFHIPFFNLAIVYKSQEQLGKAIKTVKTGLKYNPNNSQLMATLVHLLQLSCDWVELKASEAKLDQITAEQLQRGQLTGENPFISLSRTPDPKVNFAIAQSWSSHIASAVKKQHPTVNLNHTHAAGNKIRLGYLGTIFRDHAVSHLTKQLYALHDRIQFEVYCFSLGGNDQSSYRQHIEQTADKFIDLAGKPMLEVAQTINQAHIDILIDLNGYTQGFDEVSNAFKPAPIQVNYLGMPGTTGASFMDYIIADQTLIPPAHFPYYAEKVVYLPGCYQINDNSQPIGKQPTRKQYDLPLDAFVYCCFCYCYKIDAVIFDIWLKLLKQTPQSVLWLMETYDRTTLNLKKYAKKAGIDPARFIFTRKVKKPDHLARYALADLCLDTHVYTGHTTTSDALCAGTPVITILGTHFASRVSGSILSAMGVPELITQNLKEYQKLALHLASHPQKLQALRSKLSALRSSSPLFNTALSVTHLESAYLTMWHRYQQGLPPTHLSITD